MCLKEDYKDKHEGNDCEELVWTAEHWSLEFKEEGTVVLERG